MSLTFACSWDPFSPVGLLYLALMFGFVPSYAMLITPGGLLFSDRNWRSGSGGGSAMN